MNPDMPSSRPQQDEKVAHTLEDIIDTVRSEYNHNKVFAATLRATGALIASWLGREQASIDAAELLSIEAGFQRYLHSRQYRDCTVRTYLYCAQIMSRAARAYQRR